LLREEGQRSAGNEEKGGQTLHARHEREPPATDSTGGSFFGSLLSVENLSFLKQNGVQALYGVWKKCGAIC